MTNKTTGLGKGFGSLLPDDFDNSLLLDKKDRIQRIKFEDLAADKDQPRNQFDETGLNELAVSIKSYGILQPLVVRPEGEKFVIIAGERRFRAAKIAGLNSVPVLVRSAHELERLEIGLVENVQRVDLSALEQAVSIAKLNQQFNLELSEIAKRLGKADTTIINIVRLLKLPDDAKKSLQNGEITEGHARSILALNNDRKQQKILLRSIIKNGWTVRQAEQFAAQNKTQKNPKKLVKPANYTSETKSIAKKLNAKIEIKPKKIGGDLRISYKNDSDLGRIIKIIESS